MLAGVCFGLWQATAELRLRWLLDEVRTRLGRAEPAERDALAAQLVAVGPRGWPTWAESLAADDPAVRGSAQRAILEQIAGWERAADDVSRATLLQFGTRLPELAKKLSERGQCGAAVVARRLLVTRLELSLADREQLLAACADVLRLPGAALLPDAAAEWDVAAEPLAPLPALDQPILVSREGSLAESREPPALPSQAGLEPAPTLLGALPNAEDSLTVPASPVAISNAPATVRSAATNEPPPAEPERWEPSADAATPLAAPAAEPTANEAELEARLARMPAAWAGLLRAFAQAQNDDDDARSAALAQLRQRQVTDRELDVAAQLHAPDPAVRREWVRALLGLRGIDGPFWLTWMCTDSDASVRRTAFEVAATVQDPALWSAIRALAQADADATNRQLAALLETQRARLARGDTEP